MRIDKEWAEGIAKESMKQGNCYICGVPLVAHPSEKVYCEDCANFTDEEATHEG